MWRSRALAHSFPWSSVSLSCEFVSCACGLTTPPSTLAQEKRSTFAVSFRMVAELTFGKARSFFFFW